VHSQSIEKVSINTFLTPVTFVNVCMCACAQMHTHTQSLMYMLVLY